MTSDRTLVETVWTCGMLGHWRDELSRQITKSRGAERGVVAISQGYPPEIRYLASPELTQGQAQQVILMQPPRSGPVRLAEQHVLYVHPQPSFRTALSFYCFARSGSSATASSAGAERRGRYLLSGPHVGRRCRLLGLRPTEAAIALTRRTWRYALRLRTTNIRLFRCRSAVGAGVSGCRS